ncbi:hypothetical protein [Rhodococcus opacus]|uniref:hypothetical protein n=1 Tax=Rhodococcus opacus TaxID=37919 RepID=UPI0022354B85|nr:hypothetical protein [Rhodococcus opacus]UZG58013.1 hypothetical protein ONE62_12205 [Rhodococcus opacus]
MIKEKDFVTRVGEEDGMVKYVHMESGAEMFAPVDQLCTHCITPGLRVDGTNVEGYVHDADCQSDDAGIRRLHEARNDRYVAYVNMSKEREEREYLEGLSRRNRQLVRS